MRLADYVSDCFAEFGISDVYCVVGGGSMYLNDALGHNPGIHMTYTQHEQAAAMAAEGWARVTGSPAGVCVTSGPGGVNAMNGVLGAWLDSIPMFVVSGQVRYATTVESTGMRIRQQGEQEYPIIESVAPMTKYAVMVKDPSDIRYHLERAFWEATHGRRGPVWIDIPLDVQNSQIDPLTLRGFDAVPDNCDPQIDRVLSLLNHAERPVIVGGSGIRSSCMLEEFRALVEKLNIPVLGATSIVDLFPWSDPLYMGTFGNLGGRAGNYMVQTADLIINLGCSLSYKHTGFNYEAFAPCATIVSVNCEPNELKKPNVTIDVPIECALETFIPALAGTAPQNAAYGDADWLPWCADLKKRFPTYKSKFAEPGLVNQYQFAQELFNFLSEDGIEVVGNSIASVSFLQMGVETYNQRCFGNANCGSMGWDLPAAMGCAQAVDGPVWLLAGDGSIQMNIQEMQTVAFNNIPVKVVIFNNGGYQAIVTSQTNAFNRICGCTPECGEGVPDFSGIAAAYSIPHRLLNDNCDIAAALQWCLNTEGPVVLEVAQSMDQGLEPKIMSKRLADGSMASPKLTDLSPFLDEDEAAEIERRWM